LLVMAGPALVLALLVYFLAHLYHLAAIQNGNAEHLRTYPWMGVPTSRLGAILLYFSITVLPLLSVLWIVAVSALSLQTKLLFSGAYVLSLGLADLFIIRTLRELNAFVEQSLANPQSSPSRGPAR
jgi:hypothetical protein